MEVKVDINVVVHIHPAGGGVATEADLAGFVAALKGLAGDVGSIEGRPANPLPMIGANR